LLLGVLGSAGFDCEGVGTSGAFGMDGDCGGGGSCRVHPAAVIIAAIAPMTNFGVPIQILLSRLTEPTADALYSVTPSVQIPVTAQEEADAASILCALEVWAGMLRSALRSDMGCLP